ncbi:hypothetical protein [Streptomyces sp. NPDC002547]
MHDFGAQYMASVVFALTMLAAGALRTAWRRRLRKRARARSSFPKAEIATLTPLEQGGQTTASRGSTHGSASSSDGRRQVSS